MVDGRQWFDAPKRLCVFSVDLLDTLEIPPTWPRVLAWNKLCSLWWVKGPCRMMNWSMISMTLKMYAMIINDTLAGRSTTMCSTRSVPELHQIWSSHPAFQHCCVCIWSGDCTCRLSHGTSLHGLLVVQVADYFAFPYIFPVGGHCLYQLVLSRKMSNTVLLCILYIFPVGGHCFY